MSKDFLLNLYQRPQSIFTLKEISLLSKEYSSENLRRKLSYFVKVGKLKRLRNGIYAKRDYNSLELANKIYTPSYISFETVLEKEGVIFQKYKTIFVASYLSRKIKVDGQEIFYRKLKDEILLNKFGVEEKDNYAVASKERAFLDAVYLYHSYHFDNLGVLNWEEVMAIKKIYFSKILEKRVNDYYQIYKKEHV